MNEQQQRARLDVEKAQRLLMNTAFAAYEEYVVLSQVVKIFKLHLDQLHKSDVPNTSLVRDLRSKLDELARIHNGFEE